MTLDEYALYGFAMSFAARQAPTLDSFATTWLTKHGLSPADLPKITTADQFLALGPRLPPTAQLVDGQVVIQNSPTIRHQHVVLEVAAHLRDWIRRAPGRGQVGVAINTRVNSTNVYTPDVWWYCEFRKPGLDGSLLEHVPDLVVEVLSPSTKRFDVGAKRVRYQHKGVLEYWTLDPTTRRGYVWRRSEPTKPTFDVDFPVREEDDLTSPLLPAFGVNVRGVLG